MDNDNFELDFGEKVEDILSKSKEQKNELEEEISQEAEEAVENAPEEMVYEDISSSSGDEQKAKKGWWKRLSKGKKAALISVTSIILAIATLIGYVSVRFDYNYDKKFNVSVPPKDENIVNVALFGVDCRDEDDFTGLTDSIMILSINKKTDKIKIISVMRDTFVPIIDENEELKKYGKINSAYASGKEDVTKSAEIAVNTLNYVYDLDISNYAVINFYGMAEIIDAVGGITVTITPDELASKGRDKPNVNGCMQEICKEKGLNVNDYYIKKSGEQTLNGVQAVAYARVRHCKSVWGTNNDFGRTDRQRHVMQELFNKAVKMNKKKYVELVDALIPCSRTSLGPTEIVDLAVSVLLQNPGFEQYRLPPEGHITEMLMDSPSGYGSVLYYDIDYVARLVNAIIFDDKTMEEYIEENPVERNDWFKGSSRPSGSATTQNSTKPSNNTTTSNSTTSTTSKKPVVSDPIVSSTPTQSTTSEDEEIIGNETESKPEQGTESDTSSGTESDDTESGFDIDIIIPSRPSKPGKDDNTTSDDTESESSDRTESDTSSGTESEPSGDTESEPSGGTESEPSEDVQSQPVQGTTSTESSQPSETETTTSTEQSVESRGRKG